MSKIHEGQLFSILFLSGAWQVLGMHILSGGAMPGIAIALAVQILLTLPMLYLSGKGFSVTKTAIRHKWLGYVYILFFLLWGAFGFTMFGRISPLLSLPFSGGLTAVVLIALTCLYACSLGLKATARCAPFVLGIFLLSVLVLIIGAYRRVDVTRLHIDAADAVRGGWLYFCLGGELTAAWVLLDRTKDGQKRALWGSLAAKALLACLISFLCTGAAGRLSELTEYPFFILTALSQPLQEQRADALYILVCVMLYIVHITLQTGVTAHLLEAMYPRLRWAAPLSLLGMLLLTAGTGAAGDAALPIFGGLLLVTAFVIPLCFCMQKFRKEEHT